MTNIYLCIGEYAKTPYYLQEADISIYSVEELSYYLIENIHILDSSIFSQKLSDWLEEECRLPELADKLRRISGTISTTKDYVSAILRYTHYTEDERIKELERMIEKSASMNEYQKKKLQADYSFRSKHYHNALCIYQQLLNKTNKNQTEIYARLQHNIGTIYSIYYEFSKAAEAFWEAYRANDSIESKRSYILAKYFELTEDEYKLFCDDNRDWGEDFKWIEITVARSKEKWQKSDQLRNLYETVLGKARERAQYYDHVEAYVEQKKISYRKQFE